MIDVDAVMNCKFPAGRRSYVAKDTILYAVGAGAGREEVDLPFVYERGLRALPTMAVVLAGEGSWMREPWTGIDWQRALHGEQRLTLHKPLAAEGDVISQMGVDGLYDRGEGKGAMLLVSSTLSDANSGEAIATVGATLMLMGDGGFGGSMEGAPRSPQIPDRQPDLSLSMATRPEQAAIYRLSGDYNSLHIDPETARRIGFQRPILHGLCSYAVAGRVLLKMLCDNRPEQLRQLDVRFSSPVYPGETILTEVWKHEKGEAFFRCRVEGRDVSALNNGYVRYG